MMTEGTKKRLLIFYDHFYPAYKAGGPIQSLTNLVLSLQDVYDIAVITSAHDLNDSNILDNIKPNEWNDVQLPGSSEIIKVWYGSGGEPGTAVLKNIIQQVSPSVIYLNGMFSFRFVLLPLFVSKNIKIVLCPRGMLQPGALAGKAFKKKVFLFLLKMSGMLSKVTWHATTNYEAADIRAKFGEKSAIVVAENIPKKPLASITKIQKNAGSLQLVYLSLISEKKNLLLLINLISSIKEAVTLDIYGPVKDELYWKKCLQAINNANGKINYKGDVQPEYVQHIFGKYHASILLTKGENFGHALYESLSAGRPVITSFFTPWNDLKNKNAGWNLDIADQQGMAKQVIDICSLEQATYDRSYDGAYKLANEYYSAVFDPAKYKSLFSK